MNYFSPNFMSWEIKIRFLSEFCSKKIECHKPFSTLNYDCACRDKQHFHHHIPRDLKQSIIASNISCSCQMNFGCWWKFITNDGFICSHKRRVVMVILQNLHATLLTHHPRDKYIFIKLFHKFVINLF